MRLCRLAFQNVKCNLKNYVSLVLSLSFSIMFFYNFKIGSASCRGRV